MPDGPLNDILPPAEKMPATDAEISAVPETTAAETEAAQESRPVETAEAPAEVAPAPETPAPAPVKAAAPAPEAVQKDEFRVRVERVLEQDLWDLYFALSEKDRARFKAKGEESAARLRQLLDARPRPAKIDKVVHDWLKTIPKVQKHYLWQATKNKTDGVLALAREHDERRQAA